MNIFLKRFVVALLLFIVTVPLCLFMMMKHIKKWNEIVLVDVQKRKEVEHYKDPKILFVGGSNLSYGLDSDCVQDSLHMDVYNMGLHASLGLHYMLEEASEYLKKNDILVIVPEYNQFTDYYGSAALADLLIQTKRWNEFPIYKSWDAYPSYFCSKVYVPFLLKILSGKANKDIYADNPEGFNEKGDYILHLDQSRRVVARLLLLKEPSEDMMDAFVLKVNELKHKGLKVIVLPPSYQETCYEVSKPNIEKIALGLANRGLPFHCETERYCLTDTLFWNTAYHLSGYGRDVRTQLVIQDLQEIKNM